MKSKLTFLVVLLAGFAFGQVNQVDAQGRKQGKWEKTYEGSIVFQYRGQFKDDKPIGEFTYFYESGKVKAIIKHNHIQKGRSLAYFYHENKKLMSAGIYRNMKKDSIWVNFTPAGKLSTKEEFKNDKLNGVTLVYFVSDDVKSPEPVVATKKTYKNGELHGDYVEYFINGKVKIRGEYVNNRQDGAWEEFHLNGKRAITYRYDNGKKHGYQIAYDESGKRLAEVFYYNGHMLEGERLEKLLKDLESKGINPYTMTTK
ncbi:MAG: toxin-antitoxin system YwqK family antitoxin [Fluviicola sp.]